MLPLATSSLSGPDEEKSRSNVSRSESPGCRITLACSDELIKEQADGFAHLGAFCEPNTKKTKQITKQKQFFYARETERLARK